MDRINRIDKIGPRPLLMHYLERYTPQQARRHEVRPGITGWAQVNGRNGLTWEEKFRLDVWYVDHRSLWLDLKIILMTLWKVVKREGITSRGRRRCRSSGDRVDFRGDVSIIQAGQGVGDDLVTERRNGGRVRWTLMSKRQ